MTRTARTLLARGLTVALLGLSLLLGPGVGARAQEHQGATDALSRLNSAVGRSGGAACTRHHTTTAEQIIRLHTELLLTSLACADAYGDPDLYQRYREFTVRQADPVRRAQAEVTQQFGSGEAAERQFDLFRAEMANGESLLMRQVSNNVYCQMRRARFQSLMGASPEALHDYASELAARANTSSGC